METIKNQENNLKGNFHSYEQITSNGMDTSLRSNMFKFEKKLLVAIFNKRATIAILTNEMMYENASSIKLRIWNQVKLWSSQLWMQFLAIA